MYLLKAVGCALLVLIYLWLHDNLIGKIKEFYDFWRGK